MKRELPRPASDDGLPSQISDLAAQVEKLTLRLERERDARLQAEAIAERGLRQLYEKQQQLQLQEAIAAAANQAESIEQALQFALQQICRYTSWPLGHCYLTQPCDGQQRLVSTDIWYGDDDESLRTFCQVSVQMTFAAGQGLPGRVLASGAPTWIADVNDDKSFWRVDAARVCGLRAAFAFPVVSGGDVVGVLEFFSSRRHEPDMVLLRQMSQIGRQLGRVVERKQARQRLIHDAAHDALTGLPNRKQFLCQLDQALLRQWHDAHDGFAVLFIDLDRFKIINDSLGHLAGDTMIIEVASRLTQALQLSPDSCALARMGGDEFSVLLDGIDGICDAVAAAERVQAALSLPFLVRDQEIYVSVSIGIVSSETGYTRADQVLRAADLAMYRAKALGKNRYEIYIPGMHSGKVSRLTMETNLRRALKNEEFVLHYQPIIELLAGEIIGVEALIRWRRSPQQLVYPGEFIDVAEDTGLILSIGMWVLREACRQMHQWHQQFPRSKPLTISVNISPRQFAQPNLVEQVHEIIIGTGIDPATLRLEVTENVAMGDVERSIKILSQLRSLGIRFSIDDFGTGYSSLSYLHRFPLDVLKIDRSFVAHMNDDHERLQIVQTIMTLARNLGIEVVAEGTENEEQVERLRAMGCNFVQGFFFSHALTAEDVGNLLRVPYRVLNAAYGNALRAPR